MGVHILSRTRNRQQKKESDEVTLHVCGVIKNSPFHAPCLGNRAGERGPKSPGGRTSGTSSKGDVEGGDGSKSRLAAKNWDKRRVKNVLECNSRCQVAQLSPAAGLDAGWVV